MSTRKFVSIIIVALVLFILALVPMVLASAEGSIYQIDAVIVAWKTTPWSDIKVTVVDEEGSIWSYWDDEVPHVGDVVTLTMFHYGDEEDDEIIDVEPVDHLSPLETVQWLCR